MAAYSSELESSPEPPLQKRVRVEGGRGQEELVKRLSGRRKEGEGEERERKTAEPSEREKRLISDQPKQLTNVAISSSSSAKKSGVSLCMIAMETSSYVF